MCRVRAAALQVAMWSQAPTLSRTLSRHSQPFGYLQWRPEGCCRQSGVVVLVPITTAHTELWECKFHAFAFLRHDPQGKEPLLCGARSAHGPRRHSRAQWSPWTRVESQLLVSGWWESSCRSTELGPRHFPENTVILSQLNTMAFAANGTV